MKFVVILFNITFTVLSQRALLIQCECKEIQCFALVSRNCIRPNVYRKLIVQTRNQVAAIKPEVARAAKYRDVT